jgi:hypothetical protein
MAFAEDGSIVPRLSSAMKAKLVKAYEADPRIDRIGAQFGVAGGTVSRVVRAAGGNVGPSSRKHDYPHGKQRFSGSRSAQPG